MTPHLRRPVTRQEDPPMTTRPATSNHTTKEIPSKTSCTATSRGTMKGSVNDVEPRAVRRSEKTLQLTSHLAPAHGTTIDSADEVTPGDVPRHDEETQSMTSRTATTRSAT